MKGPTVQEARRTAFEVMRPIVHLLRTSGVAAGDVRSVTERALRGYTRVPARGAWLDRASLQELADVLMVWAGDPEFIDEAGSPVRLTLEGGPRSRSFPYLLKKAGVSLAADRALEQLRMLGSVQRCDRGRRIRLVSHVLTGLMGRRFLAAPMLDAIRRFAETLEHNLCARHAAQRRMHRCAGCASLDPRHLGEVQRFVRSSGEAFLDAVDEKLLSSARKDAKERLRYGVGIYVFMDPAGKTSHPRTRRRHTRPR
ncbi:MAG: hypothetical protein ACRD6W_14265 [Nitrososphaerales archaeon]